MCLVIQYLYTMEVTALQQSEGQLTKNHVQPDVGEYGPGGSHKEDTQMLNLSHFIIGNDILAQTNNHEQVEGSRSDNGT